MRSNPFGDEAMPKTGTRGGCSKPVVPTPEMVQWAREMIHQLSHNGARFELKDKETGATIPIEENVYEIFRMLLIDFAQNRPVSLVPLCHQLTTFEAANFLNVSRGYLLKLLDANKIPYQRVGSHRRIRLEDLIEYKDRMRVESDRAVEELSTINQELGID
jgi:excisionase family DNA binding protein